MKGIAKNSQEYVDAIGLKRWLGLDLEFDQDVKSPEEALVEVELKVRTAIAKSNGQGMLDSSVPPGPPPVIQVQQQEVRIGVLVDDIMSCKELAVLDSYRLMVKGSDELTAAYTKRRSELISVEVDVICKKTEEFSESINEHLKQNPKLAAAYKKRFDKL